MGDVASNKYISPIFHEHLQTTFEHVNQLLEIDSFKEAKEILAALHHADLATYIENIPYKAIEQVLDLLGKDFKAEALVSLSSGGKQNVAEVLGIDRLAYFINLLDTEDAIEVMDDIPEDLKEATIPILSKEKQQQIIEGFTYPEDTAGRVMEKEFVVLRDDWNISEALDAFKKRSVDSDFYAAIVVNTKHKPLGCVLLCKMLKYPHNTLIKDVMETDLKIADTHTRLDELAYIFKQYALTVVPVVNKVGRLVGTISINNMIYIIEQQAEDEFMHFGGVSTHDMFYDLLSTVKHRFPWLFFNLITACITAVIINQFNSTIEQIVTLAAIMPIVASMGGNAGTQTMTVTVRSLHNKGLNYSSSFKIISKELFVCGINGVMLSIVGSLIILLTFSDVYLSVVFAAAVIISFLVAGFAGAFIPIFLSKLNIDPAAASGVFLTTLTDIVGFSTFLALAYFFLV